MIIPDIQNKIKLTLQLFISCLIGLEVAFKPNPYIQELIFLLFIYIAFKYNLPNKTIQIIKKYLIT